MRRRKFMLLAPLCALAALAFAAAPAHAVQLGLEEPHSPNAETISTAYWVMIAIVFAVLIAVNAALIAAVVRFRERRGREPSRFSAGRGALRPVVAALSLLALGIFVFGIFVTEDAREIEPSGPDGLASTASAQVGVKGVPPLPALEGAGSSSGEEPAGGEDPAEAAPLQINAIAQQWLWRFEYPGGQPGQRTFSYGELTVPVDTAVILNVRSTDVLHSWWVPALGGQVQAAPGEVTQTWFKADEVGRYPGRSTIFSGSAYPVMRSWVNVVPATDYEAYVSDLSSDLSEAQGAVEEQNSGTLQDPVGSSASPEAGE